MQCPECQIDLVSQIRSVPVYTGSNIVESEAQCDSCANCDYYEIACKDGELLELHAAQVVLHESQEIDGRVIKFARKVLGLTKAELGKKLNLSETTIDLYESGKLLFLPTYVLALSGLLAYAERSLLGINLGYIRK